MLFASKIYRVREGKLVTPVFIDYYKYLLSGNTTKFEPVFAHCTAQSTKAMVLKALKDQAYISIN